MGQRKAVQPGRRKHMDHTTQLAPRGLVRGLREEGVIDARQTGRIVEALAAADAEAARSIPSDNPRYYLRALCMDVAKDAGIECPINDPRPPIGR
jgi:hypothetical protein